MYVRHARFAAAPVTGVLESHIRAARDQGRQVVRIVGRASAAAKEHNRIVEH